MFINQNVTLPGPGTYELAILDVNPNNGLQADPYDVCYRHHKATCTGRLIAGSCSERLSVRKPNDKIRINDSAAI